MRDLRDQKDLKLLVRHEWQGAGDALLETLLISRGALLLFDAPVSGRAPQDLAKKNRRTWTRLLELILQ
jgi:hypothetical protein